VYLFLDERVGCGATYADHVTIGFCHKVELAAISQIYQFSYLAGSTSSIPDLFRSELALDKHIVIILIDQIESFS
jgi:hypothetical protein